MLLKYSCACAWCAYVNNELTHFDFVLSLVSLFWHALSLSPPRLHIESFDAQVCVGSVA